MFAFAVLALRRITKLGLEHSIEIVSKTKSTTLHANVQRFLSPLRTIAKVPTKNDALIFSSCP